MPSNRFGGLDFARRGRARPQVSIGGQDAGSGPAYCLGSVLTRMRPLGHGIPVRSGAPSIGPDRFAREQGEFNKYEEVKYGARWEKRAIGRFKR
jgi:hypothetical protein